MRFAGDGCSRARVHPVGNAARASGGWGGGVNRVCVRSRNAGCGQAGGRVRVGLH